MNTTQQDNLNQIKILLNLKSADKDDLLTTIMNLTQKALLFKLGLNQDDDVPPLMNYILIEVSIRRFNKLKNEGFTSYSQEGETINFSKSDFDDFLDDINSWKAQNNKHSSLGHVQFINPYGGEF